MVDEAPLVGGLVVGRHFRDQTAGGHGVFVAHEVADEVAVALLAADEELFLALELADLLGDVFEASEHVVALHVEVGGDLVDQVGGDDGFHHEKIVV